VEKTMIILKDGVKIAGLQDNMQPALDAVEIEYLKHNLDVVITSAMRPWDKKSKHSKGLAFDIRTFTLINKEEINKVHANLVKELLTYYDVILERDHIHIEWEPK
jgi:hypothetical protein